MMNDQGNILIRLVSVTVQETGSQLAVSLSYFKLQFAVTRVNLYLGNKQIYVAKVVFYVCVKFYPGESYLLYVNCYDHAMEKNINFCTVRSRMATQYHSIHSELNRF